MINDELSESGSDRIPMGTKELLENCPIRFRVSLVSQQINIRMLFNNNGGGGTQMSRERERERAARVLCRENRKQLI